MTLPANPSTRFTTALETLEPRTLLAASLADDGTLHVIGTRKADTIFITHDTGSINELYVRINKDEWAFAIADIERIRVQSGALGDHIEFRALATNPDYFKIPTTIYGSTGDDLIIGAGSRNRIYGGTGHDKIFAGFSRDIVYGEEGNDSIDGGQGNDYLRGGEGNDRLVGGLGIDEMYGDEDDDRFYSRNDLPFRADNRPFLLQDIFDRVDGGGGVDRASSDDVDRLVSIERTFVAR